MVAFYLDTFLFPCSGQEELADACIELPKVHSINMVDFLIFKAQWIIII